MKAFFISLVTLLLFVNSMNGQRDFYQDFTFTEADTLRGALRPERTCFDVYFYDLDLKIDPEKKYINGVVEIAFEATVDFERMQIDLFDNMQINSIEIEYTGQRRPNMTCEFERIHHAVFVKTPAVNKGEKAVLRINYEGAPIAAQNAPWDGGFVWSKDKKDNHWIGVACEGTGASLWWPNKDHLSDEPDSLRIQVSVPEDLMCIANGNLRSTMQPEIGWKKYNWFVSYPINNYNVSVNIAKYAHFAETYTAEDGEELLLDYYVLPYNLERAKEHFKQVKPMLKCYEEYFGKYPYWKDGFAMVETPYLGMEHQSAIAYGNKYMRGYLGGMIPKDMDWDFIIIHETGHEYFGNAISTADHSEMWIHESFTTYMEALYVECTYSYPDMVRYLMGQRRFLGNEQPILGPKDVNFGNWKHSDHYYKGSWVLHTLRHAMNDDELFFKTLRGFYEKYLHIPVTSDDFVNYVNEQSGQDYTAFFEQYLWYPTIPKLQYKLKQKGKKVMVKYRWQADVSDFDMPIAIGFEGETKLYIQPKVEVWQEVVFEKAKVANFRVAQELFLIGLEEVE